MPDTAVLWFNLMGYNQHDVTTDLHKCCYDGKKLRMDKAQVECHSFIISAGTQAGTKSPESGAPEPFSMSRAWRLYSLECATRAGQDIYVACKSGIMACTRLFPNGTSKYGSLDPWVTETMYHIDVNKVACSREECAKDILLFINDGPAACGQAKLQRRMKRWAACHLVPFGASSPDSLTRTNLDELCCLRGFSINSLMAKSSLGQSSLHEAVAADSVELAEKMLAHGCLVNATDSMQETPLHYAAMRGNIEMIFLLLRARADVHMESRYGEAPYDVAKQNVAAFIHNRDSSEIMSILCAEYLKDQAGMPS